MIRLELGLRLSIFCSEEYKDMFMAIIIDGFRLIVTMQQPCAC